MTDEQCPTWAETIRTWLPPHAYQSGPKPFESLTVWTWTTPDGTWRIRCDRPLLFGTHTLTLTGPGGEWRFGRANPTTLRRLHDVLVALNAISEESDIVDTTDLAIWRHEVPIDDQWHHFHLNGDPVFVATDGERVEFWAYGSKILAGVARKFRVFNTGHPLPKHKVCHWGTAIHDYPAGRGVWHLIESCQNEREDAS